ncbi:uncharacterized protein LOC144752739 [Lissotriton helveticus]
MRGRGGVQKGVKRAVKEVESVRLNPEPVLDLDYGDESDELEEGEVRDDAAGFGGAADNGDIDVLQAPAVTQTKAGTAAVQVAAPRGRPRERTSALTGCVGGPGHKTVTWIVGHSFVHWASKYAEQQVYGRNLGLKEHLHEVQWWGKGGMRWGALLPWLAKMVPQRGCPDLLIIHLGENDLVQLSGLALVQLMQRDLEVLKSRLAGTCIAWTELVPRKVWRGAMKHGAIEKARRKLNRAMRLYCVDKDIKVIAHGGIRLEEPLAFRDDGVHLSRLGNAWYMMEMRDVVSKLWNENIWCVRE